MMRNNVIRMSASTIDKCFFRPSDIKLGTVFVNRGRIHNGELFRVTYIRHEKKGRSTRVEEGQSLRDDITLVPVGSGGNNIQRSGSIGYFIYSAIWWLE